MTNGQLDLDAYDAYSPAFYSAGNLIVYCCFFPFYTLTFVFIILDFWRPLAKAYRRMCSAAWSQIKYMFFSLHSAAISFGTGNFRQGFHHLVHMMDGEGSVYDGFDDPFTQMMRNCKEVPDWWFFIIAVIAFISAIIILKTW